MSELKKGLKVKVILPDGQELNGEIDKMEEGFFWVKARNLTLDTVAIGEEVKFLVKNLYEKSGKVLETTEKKISFWSEGVKVTYAKEDIYSISLV